MIKVNKENEIKSLLQKKMTEFIDEVELLKEQSYRYAIWGNNTEVKMADAAFAVFSASMESQEDAIDEGYFKLVD